jgi:tRNA(Ile)-lysidine synthase
MKLEKGVYIVAVSGGVDSVVLLNMLSKQKACEFIVAHFNHGIRDNAVRDEELVAALSKQYGFKLAVEHGKLGTSASEEIARNARYEFLNQTKEKYQAKAIITGHHQDDVIETAIINLLRGTSRQGLSSLKSGSTIIRPLLSMNKQAVYKYAQDNKLEWVEDQSNIDETYLRNWVRANIMPKLKPGSDNRSRFLDIIKKSAGQNILIDKYIATMSQKLQLSDNNRSQFILLPDTVAREVAASMLKIEQIKNINKRMVSRVVNIIKTAKANTKHDLDKTHILFVETKKFRILRS